jgi:formate hydrogenlyase subunit 6/NADH:ubiquinone oxidoreductase subunit I
MTYFSNLKRGVKTTWKGLSLTIKHFWAARHKKGTFDVQDSDYFKFSGGYVTLQYPHEHMQIPDNGRYQLDCEIDDCIVCDKCAKICPVDCIEIEAIKSTELIRTTSDGSPVRLHAAKFNIDMAKCCFCGLCTTVCPTECLTMNSEYDYSVVDITQLNFAFANLTEKEANEKRELYEQFVAEKEALKANAMSIAVESKAVPSGFKPSLKPKIPTLAKIEEQKEITEGISTEEAKLKNDLNLLQNTENPNSQKPKVGKFAPKLRPVNISQNTPAPQSEAVPNKESKLRPVLPINDSLENENPSLPSEKFPKEIKEKTPSEVKLEPNLNVVSKESAQNISSLAQEKQNLESSQDQVASKKFVPKLKPKK